MSYSLGSLVRLSIPSGSTMTDPSNGGHWISALRSNVWNALTVARQRLQGQPTLELVAPLTLVLLLLYPVGVTEIRIALQIGCVAGLLYRPLYRVPVFWILMATLMGVGCILLWEDADNHKYLIAYWCLALGLSCAAEDTSRAIRMNARALVGLCFLIAVSWKLRTPDFLSGEYYQFSILTDDRFFGLGQLISDMTPQAYFQNQEAIDSLTAFPSTVDEVSLDGSALLRPFSKALVAWTLLVELWIVVSFLCPGRSSWAARSRYLSLLVFAGTTYAVATVSGFAWVLLIMGLAAVRPADGPWRLAYLGVLALVILYQLGPVEYLLVLLHG